ncbi:hypothetical protein J2S57_000688 [Kineosporia succinea]|uniref:DUF11 domain-containing protein n=1 Tax=Kineosporia succinea TaxID=84632 RepID=A0ABT9NXQ6_9ACTN|nr:hypothetical protein [Kineosporia succinea]MDP9824939.1 hypothetical protein [Kineosporia succinea]
MGMGDEGDGPPEAAGSGRAGSGDAGPGAAVPGERDGVVRGQGPEQAPGPAAGTGPVPETARRSGAAGFRLRTPGAAVLAWASLVGTEAALVALYPVFFSGAGSGAGVPEPSRGSGLEAVKVGLEQVRTVDGTSTPPGGTPRPDRVNALDLDVRVRNVGEVAASVTDLAVRVIDVTEVPVCYLGIGGFESFSATYAVTVPEQAEAGDEIRVPVAQSVAAGSTDRFALTLGSELDIAAYSLEITALEGERRTRLDTVGVLVLPGAASMYRDNPGLEPVLDRDCAQEALTDLERVASSARSRSRALDSLIADLRTIAAGGRV